MAYDITLEGKNKIIAERMLEKVAKILKKCNIEHWIEGGTLLGIRRENRLLPWDNDIDFSIKSTEIPKLKKFLFLLRISGYRASLRYFSEGNPHFKTDQLRIIKIRESKYFRIKRGPVCAEIFVKYQIGDTHFWEVANKSKSVPSKFYEGFKTLPFNGYDYSAPLLTDEYLTYRYNDWQVQVKDWNTTTDDKALDKS